MGAVLYQGYKTNLRIGARSSAGPRTGESIFVDLLVGHIESAAIHAHQPPSPIPRATRAAQRNRLDQLVVQLLHRLPAQPRAGLRDARLARHTYPGRWIVKPLHSFQQTAQYLAIGRLHIKSQSDHIVNHHLCGKVALTNAGLARTGQHRTDRRIRKRLGDDAKADVVRNPRTRRKFRNRTRQLWPPVPVLYRMPQISLSEQYYAQSAFLTGCAVSSAGPSSGPARRRPEILSTFRLRPQRSSDQHVAHY